MMGSYKWRESKDIVKTKYFIYQGCRSGSAWIGIIFGRWIWIRIRVKSWIRIRMKVKIQKLYRLKLEP